MIGGAGSIGSATVKEIFNRNPKLLHVVDISENNLVELVRDLRSSYGYISGEFKTMAIDIGSNIYDKFIIDYGKYDYVLNFSALKHVRSEKDLYTLMRMVEVNILNTIKTIEQSARNGSKKYFCVSTDKASNSTLAGAFADSKIHIPVTHIEAGLRSFNKKMPEERNRILADHVSTLLFCPTETAVRNLEREGITKGVYLVGDVIYDSVLYSVKIAEKKSDVLTKLNLKPKKYALTTIHRAENTDNPERLTSIFFALEEISKNSLLVILPLQPRTKKYVNSLHIDINTIRIIEFFLYFAMLLFEKNTKIILTDSGGVQKEAFFLMCPA